MTAERFDFVFHYAAVVGVKRTLENPLMVLQDIEGIKNILRLCKNTRVKRLFFSSSSEVYGEHAEKLVAMNIFHMTSDEAKKLALEAKAKKEEHEYWKSTDVTTEYLKDLEELK